MRRKNLRLSLVSPVCMAVVLGFMRAPVSLAQTGAPVAGTVTTKDGQPVAEVRVYGSKANTLPSKREETTTDRSGEFRLEHPGAVIHFVKKGFQPHALVVMPGTSTLRVVLQTARGDLLVPICRKPQPGQKRLGWGRQGIYFDVPKRRVRILGGKPDVDFVVYVIKPKKGDGQLELWYGVPTLGVQPEDDLFTNSATFAQRSIVTSDGGLLGMDSSGRLPDGRLWRHTAVAGQGGSIYRNASAEDAATFDSVISSLCVVFP